MSNTETTEMTIVRYMVDDVVAAVDFYTKHFGFEEWGPSSPAFADVAAGTCACCSAVRRARRAARCRTAPSRGPEGGTGSTSSTHDLDAEIARLQAEGVPFRNDVVTGPGGKQILVEDPSGNLIELFQPAAQ